MVNSVEIRCTKDGPNLVVVDGNVLQQGVDAALQQTSHNVMERIEKLTSRLKKRQLKSSKGQQVDKPCHTVYRPC